MALLAFAFNIIACSEQEPPQTSSSKSQSYPSLFTDRNPHREGRNTDKLVKPGMLAVSLNKLVATAPLNSPYILPLTPSRQYALVFEQRSIAVDGVIVLNGYLSDFGRSYRITLTLGKQSVFGRILTPDGVINVSSDEEGVWLLNLDQAGLNSGGNVGDQKIKPVSIAPTSKLENRKKILPRSTHLSMIDVLVFYSTGLASRFSPEALQTRLKSLFSVANSALSDSQIQLRYRLVQSIEVNYPDNISNDIALNELSAGTGAFQDVTALRSQYGADLVTFVRAFVNDGSNSCGAAWLNGADGSALQMDSAYSVVSDGQDGQYYCDDVTLAHELGHSLGSSHEAGDVDAIGHFPYSYGYGAAGRFGTVMSYITPQSGKFSNPNIATCLGNICGVLDQADNARSMNLVRGLVENFLSALPTISILPTATTSIASNITENSASLQATITPGNLATESYFEYGTSQGNYTHQTPVQNITADIVSQDISEAISSLQCGQAYYYRAIAKNVDGEAQGQEFSFTTLDCSSLQPFVQTLAAGDIGMGAATLGGVINTQGTSASYFFEYGVAGSFANSTAIVPVISDVDQEVTEQISGLVCGSTYDYRLVAEIGGVRLEGEAIPFTTLACATDFSIAVPVISNVTQNSVDLEALLIGSQDGDIVFFEFGLNPDFTDKSPEQLVNGQISLLDTLNGLQCESTYNVRAVVRRDVESAMSDPVSFTTEICSGGSVARVETGEVSGMGQTGVTFVGILNPSPLSAQVFFEYGVDLVDENRTRSQILSTVIDSINVRQFVAALTCDTIYKYRIAANVAGEIVYGETKTFITNPCVIANALLETLDPEIISSTSVSFRAKVDPDGLPTSVYFEYGVDENLDMVTPQYSIGDGKMPRSFSWLVNGLLCGATYQYRAMAVSTPIDGGEDIIHAGSILGFVTDACEAININKINVWATKTSASIDVILNTFGESTEFVLSYGDTEEKIERSKSFTVSSGTVHLQLQGLQCGTIYYFSVIASNINGGIISDQDSFSTQDCALVPGVFSEPAIDITAKSASLIARVTPNGTATSAYFNYGVESQFDKSTLAEVVGVSFVDQFVSHNITGLLCETTYQYRIVASNEDGVSNGDALSFTTAACGSEESLGPQTESRLLDAGGEFSVVIGSQGSVIAWGDNSEGQLGVDASGINRFAGIKDEAGNTIQNIIKVAAGQNHVLALVGNNKLLAWGDNKHGQLGNGENQSVATPLFVGNGSFGELFGVVDIGAGNNHSVAVMENGTVFTWGENKMGQLGIRSKQNSSSPVQVAGIENAKKISVGANHNLVLLDDGRVLAWGANESGQLGDESTEAKLQPVEILFEQAVVAIYSGENFSFAQDDEGVIWAWGDNQFGQLGLGDRRARSKPASLPLDVNVLDIAAGKAHSIALIEDGTLLAWGDNSKGQLARSIEATGASETPIPVWVEEGKALVDIVAIAAGDRHSVALSDAGNLLAWGDGGLGQLGSQRDQSLSIVPVVVSDESGSPVSLKVPRIIVSTDSLSIIEGESSSFYIRLSSAPEVSVRVQYEIDGDTKFTLDEKSRISFDATNWDKDQEIIVQVEKDEDRLNDLATLVMKVEGYIDQRVNIIQTDNHPRQPAQRVATLDDVMLAFLVLLSLFCRAKVTNRLIKYARWRIK